MRVACTHASIEPSANRDRLGNNTQDREQLIRRQWLYALLRSTVCSLVTRCGGVPRLHTRHNMYMYMYM